ncbi:hypothetical protein FANTH_9771 [Fusarium anthophilum]|uniref:Frequency clock protein n=1 Tax=Fusarium anthophilum TaxID=48485 RepID=A0A8H4Z4P2_9HYPO|nr:hypothetical protein FANTH_9771 [Fusarium anthophilum]
MLHKDKLFEIKTQGLPLLRKRELEAILRDFATGLEKSPEASSSQEKTSPHSGDHIYSKCRIGHKHAPSSSGTNLRPTSSAYASLSASAGPSSTPISLPTMSSAKSSSSKVEDYLRDVPDGLYPHHITMTDKERKSLVFRRLEQLFTGGTSGVGIAKVSLVRPGGSFVITRNIPDTQMEDLSTTYEPPTHGTEPIQEARIPHLEQQSRPLGNECHSAGFDSVTDPNLEDKKGGGNDGGLVSSTKPSPLILPFPEQRPIRPCDLDPDRTQVPFKNMNYIRNLSRLPPESSLEQQSIQDVYLDAEGWMYLSLLYNLAQLHLINVTSNFVRSSVSEGSSKLQLSPDGHKIRWRALSNDNKSSSSSSSYDSQGGPFTDDIDGSEKKSKRRKTSYFTTDESQYGRAIKDMPRFEPQFCARVESFRYKPLFAQQSLSARHTSRTSSVYSFTAVDDDNPGDAGLGLTHPGRPACRSQHHEGAISYYSGMPFCIDLSGDPATISSTVRTLSSDQSQENSQQYMKQQELTPCGLGGVMPADHFMVVVNTKRPKQHLLPWAFESQIGRSNEDIERIIPRQAATLTSCPVPGGSEANLIKELPSIKIEYLSWHMKGLVPVPLPSAVNFFPTFSTDNSKSGKDDDLSIAAEDDRSSGEDMS